MCPGNFSTPLHHQQQLETLANGWVEMSFNNVSI